MTNTAPAFQFYAKDFLAETAFLSMEGRGVFITLKSFYWIKNGLPNDLRLLARLCALSEDQFTTIWENEVKDLFKINEDLLIIAELEDQREFQEQKRNKAKASADARWKNADAMRTDMPTQCTSTSTPNSVSNETGETPVMRRIWKDGVELLVQSGIAEKTARSLLGKLAQTYTNDLLAECIAVTQSKNPVNPQEFLIGTLKARMKADSKKSEMKSVTEREAERQKFKPQPLGAKI